MWSFGSMTLAEEHYVHEEKYVPEFLFPRKYHIY